MTHIPFWASAMTVPSRAASVSQLHRCHDCDMLLLANSAEYSFSSKNWSVVVAHVLCAVLNTDQSWETILKHTLASTAEDKADDDALGHH